jgi:hypothetical protein
VVHSESGEHPADAVLRRLAERVHLRRFWGLGRRPSSHIAISTRIRTGSSRSSGASRLRRTLLVSLLRRQLRMECWVSFWKVLFVAMVVDALTSLSASRSSGYQARPFQVRNRVLMIHIGLIRG